MEFQIVSKWRSLMVSFIINHLIYYNVTLKIKEIWEMKQWRMYSILLFAENHWKRCVYQLRILTTSYFALIIEDNNKIRWASHMHQSHCLISDQSTFYPILIVNHTLNTCSRHKHLDTSSLHFFFLLIIICMLLFQTKTMNNDKLWNGLWKQL